MSKVINEIAIITQVGPRIYKRGEDFDSSEERQTGLNEASFSLFRDGEIVAWIHPAVPVVVEYARE